MLLDATALYAADDDDDADADDDVVVVVVSVSGRSTHGSMIVNE